MIFVPSGRPILQHWIEQVQVAVLFTAWNFTHPYIFFKGITCGEGFAVRGLGIIASVQLIAVQEIQKLQIHTLLKIHIFKLP